MRRQIYQQQPYPPPYLPHISISSQTGSVSPSRCPGWIRIGELHHQPLQLCGNPMAVGLFSRNCMVQNNYTAGTMIVEAIRRPAGSRVIRVKIPSKKHKFIRYSDLHIPYNECEIAVSVYLEGASGDGKESLLASKIRDNQKIELNYMGGTVTVNPIEGNMIAMNGFVIILKRVASRLSHWGNRLETPES